MSEIKVGSRVRFYNPEIGEPKTGVVIEHHPDRDSNFEYTGNREWFVKFDEPLFEAFDHAFCAGRDLEVLP